jgi:mannosyltransferase OCH1-like enzyme
MYKWLLLLLPALALGLFLLFRAPSRESFSKKWENARDFETMMGKGQPAWKYVQTREDKEHFNFFRKLYEKNFERALAPVEAAKIPLTLHLIWLGPQEFPQESLRNVTTWIEKHPSWTVKFWTDHDRASLHPKIQTILVQDSHLPNLLSCYYLSDNFGERSELLRYEILFAEGGVYIDHDLLCQDSLDPFNHAYDFYCGLSELGPSILSSSVFASTHLIASKAHHPILSAAMEWVKKRWSQIETDFPGNDPASVMNRVKHRTFNALNEGIQQKIDREKNIDIVLPPAFFSQSEPSESSFAIHLHAASWLKQENAAQARLVNESEQINRRIATAETLLYVQLLLSLFLLAGIFLKTRKAKHA